MSARPPIAIVADDLTGLQAIAAEFRKLAFTASTFLHARDASLDGAPDIIGVDTHSRHLPPSEAASIVRATVCRLRDLGITHFYKQCDSGMQGPFAAEITSMADALARGVVYAPACPVLGRVTREGRQVGAGGLDVDISALWRQQTGVAPQMCDASQWAWRSATGDSPAWIVDAQTDADLNTLVTQAWPDVHPPASPPWLLAGSVGLASALAAVWRTCWPLVGARPVLVVAGSQQVQTRRQIDALYLATHAAMVPLPAGRLDAAHVTGLVAQLEAVLAAGRHVVLSALASEAPSGDPAYPYLGQAARLAFEHNLQRVLNALLADRMGARGTLIAGVLVAGGATSELLLREVLAAYRLEVDAWLAPGVVASVAHLAGSDRLPIVTKAGTWGDVDVAARAIQWIVERDLQLQRSK